jgi:hypothetical protein
VVQTGSNTARASVVLGPGYQPSDEIGNDLAAIASSMPGWSEVVSSFEFVADLPRSANDRLSRRRLREVGQRAGAPQPDTESHPTIASADEAGTVEAAAARRKEASRNARSEGTRQLTRAEQRRIARERPFFEGGSSGGVDEYGIQEERGVDRTGTPVPVLADEDSQRRHADREDQHEVEVAERRRRSAERTAAEVALAARERSWQSNGADTV